MVLNISESGMLLESSARASAQLPAQAFAIALSGSVIEDMIACVQNGGDIQLALGSNPKFLFDDHELRIPKSSDPSGYDLFLANSDHASSVSKLPDPTMSIFRVPKHKLKAKPPKAPKPPARGEPAAKKAAPRAPAKSNAATPRPGTASARDSESKQGPDAAAAQLERSFANLAADKRENSAVIVGGLLPSSKGGKFNANNRLLGAQAAPSSRSMPPSPALSGIGSPSLASSGNTAQERVKQQRFPILHELAVQELSRSDLWARWDEGTEEEFMTALNKVADFDKDHQKWVLKRNCWKELDVFEYDYANEEDRQKAINNAIRQYDRLRISASDPLWQKLLPKAERGKGTCLSRLQAALAKGPSVPAAKQRADTASVSGGDSEKDDPTALKKGKGGEAMSRSSSQTSTTGKKKLSASEARAKRLLADPKKKKAVVEPTKKAAPKTAAPKSTAAAKAKPTKDERVLSKEIVTDSDSSDEEVSLAASTKPKAPAASTSKPPQRVAERPRATEKTRESLPLKPKPAAMTKAPPREEKREKERDTIRAQVIAKPIKPRTKRSWEDDDDDSSSSGTPLSKRTKPVAKALPAPTTSSAKARTASDASQNSRGGANSGAAVPKAKNTSPAKSSPLASSPPTNASDADQERRDRLARIRDRERERDRDRERGRDTAVRSSSSSTDSSSVGAGVARKRPLPGAADNHHNRAAKRLRPSQEAIEMATRFKHFYARYQQLHHDITSHDNPDPGKVTDLLDMHERLSRWKTEIYAAVEA